MDQELVVAEGIESSTDEQHQAARLLIGEYARFVKLKL
jgi:hypothetical protein